LQKSTGYTLSNHNTPGGQLFPPNVSHIDGLSEDEVISIALWNNAQFQADLAVIEITQADIIDAGTVSNPLLRYLAPNGGLQVSGYINFAFDFLFQRPKRIASAQFEALRVSETMVQRGYALIREAQLAYTDVLLSKERYSILVENARVRSIMSQLAYSRLHNGDISELEVVTFSADSATAQDELARAALDTATRQTALNILMGYRPDTSIILEPTIFFADSSKIVQTDYLQLAYEYQPDLRAAQISIQATGRRLGWERSRILAFIGTLNFQHSQAKGGSKWLPNTFNPGVQLELPLLNRNQGRIARVRAEMEQAAFQYYAVRQRIALEAENAYNRYDYAWKSYHAWNGGTLPALEEAVRLSQSSYRNGDISYLPVLEAQRQLLNARLRRLEIQGEIRRSVSALNFSIGNKWNN
jgi:cobalt-zinc-cadmium efflux system outer membrane protein